MWRIGPDAEKHYRDLIAGFLVNEGRFKAFRQDRFYKLVIGEPDAIQSHTFFHKLPDSIKKDLDKYVKADEVGSPHRYKIDGQWISPNLCRYLNSVMLIEKEFGSLDGWHVAEIGCGFGGLANAVNIRWHVASYYVSDLPEPMELAVKYNQQLGVSIHQGPSPYPLDLGIAEYSLTELEGDDLITLTRGLLMPARNIFVRCNIKDELRRKQWIDILREKFEIQMYDEEPATVSFNKIVVGRSEDKQV